MFPGLKSVVMWRFVVVVVLFILSLFFGLLCLELALRFFAPHPFGFAKGGVVNDAVLCYALTPNFSTVFPTKQQSDRTVFTTTAFGNRHSGVFNKSLPSVLVIGDSFTLATQVSDDETFASLLSRELNKNGASVNILNFGVFGYNTLQYVRLLNRTIGMFNTSHVFLNFYIANDFITLEDASACVMRVVNGYLVNARWNNLSLSFKIRALLGRHTHTFAFISEKINNVLWLRSVLFRMGFALSDPYYNAEALLFSVSDGETYFRDTLRLLDEMRYIAFVHNATFSIAVIPAQYHVVPELWDVFKKRYKSVHISEPVRKPYQVLLEYGRMNNVTVVDLFDVFSKEGVDFAPDGHYNALGHRKHAAAVLPVFRGSVEN